MLKTPPILSLAVAFHLLWVLAQLLAGERAAGAAAGGAGGAAGGAGGKTRLHVSLLPEK